MSDDLQRKRVIVEICPKEGVKVLCFQIVQSGDAVSKSLKDSVALATCICSERGGSVSIYRVDDVERLKGAETAKWVVCV